MFDGYLTSPYTVLPKDDISIRHMRYMAAVDVLSWALNGKLWLYSPIVHTHPVAQYGRLPGSFEYWREFDTVGISACRQLCILTLPGWQASHGVRAELMIARSMMKTISYIHKVGPTEYTMTPTSYDEVQEDIKRGSCSHKDCYDLGEKCPMCAGTKLRGGLTL